MVVRAVSLTELSLSRRRAEQRIGFRLRSERAERYAEFVGRFAAQGDVFPEESLLEDAVALALGEAPDIRRDVRP